MGWSTRFITTLAFVVAGIVFVPEAITSETDGSRSLSVSPVKLAYLLCFATAWGAVFWVTLIGSTVMFKNLSRHQFGKLQEKMFAAYFLLVTTCVGTAVGAFAFMHPWRTASSTEKYQLGFLLSSFVFSLSNLVVFTPMTIEMMKTRHKLERELNIGEEVGWSKNVIVAKTNPKLADTNKKFGWIHGLSSLANIMSFGSLAMHALYLTSKLNL